MTNPMPLLMEKAIVPIRGCMEVDVENILIVAVDGHVGVGDGQV